MLPDLAALEYFHFLRPLWGLLFIPWLLLIWSQRRRRRSQDMFGGIIAPHLLKHLRLSRFNSRWLNPFSLGSVFTLLTLLILMGPSWRQQPSPLSQDEAAIVVLLDVSRSMEQHDIQPSRLQRAKQKIADLLASRPDKKSALIVYSGSAHTVLTLTADQDILKQYLAALDPRMMPRAGKFPEYALPRVDQILRDTTAPASVVLFADGSGADSYSAFADYFATQPHQLLVVGIGTQGDAQGLIPLEVQGLKDLASAADGSYIDLTVDDSDVRQLERRIDSHYVIIEDDALPWLDSGYPLVFVCMAVFLMWFRKGWTISWAWLLVPLLLAAQPAPVLAQTPDEETAEIPVQTALGYWFADLWMTRDQQGRALMQIGQYRQAAARFENPLWKGMAYYYNEDFMPAAEYFSRSDSDDALFDEANARAHARDFLRSVKRYDRLLERTPDYPGAAENRAKVQQLIDDINRLSEAQQPEDGVGSEEKEMGGDEAIPAEGAEELVWEDTKVKQLTAEEILQNEATADMWLRGVQQDPSNFLAIKFSMQLQREEAAP